MCLGLGSAVAVCVAGTEIAFKEAAPEVAARGSVLLLRPLSLLVSLLVSVVVGRGCRACGDCAARLTISGTGGGGGTIASGFGGAEAPVSAACTVTTPGEAALLCACDGGGGGGAWADDAACGADTDGASDEAVKAAGALSDCRQYLLL